jgi:hypothetical protein
MFKAKFSRFALSGEPVSVGRSFSAPIFDPKKVGFVRE